MPWPKQLKGQRINFISQVRVTVHHSREPDDRSMFAMSFDSTEKKRAMDTCILISFFSIYSPSSPTQGLAQQPKRGLLHQITIKIIPDTFQVLNLIKATLHRCTWRLGLTVSSTAENGLASQRGSQHSQHP